MKHAFLLFPGPSPAESAEHAWPAASSSPTTPDDRSTAFQPVEGGTEHRSGEALLVAAYAGLWALLLGWVILQWTRQTALARRLDALEHGIERALRDGPPVAPAVARRDDGEQRAP